MTLVRSLVAAAGIVAIALGARADEASRVAALDVCPSGADGCLEIMLHWDFARTDKPPVVGARAVEGKRVLRVRGRLGDKPVTWFRLGVSAAKTTRGNHLGLVAYLGRSRQGRPIILTERGPLAIETRGLLVGRGDAVVIIDERVGKVVRSFLGGLDGGTYVVRDVDHVAVLSKSGACVSPPLSRPGLMTTADSCATQSKPAAGTAFSEPIAGAIATAGDADLALIRRLLPQTRDLDDAQLRARIGRLDAHHLVVTPWGTVSAR